MPRSKRGGRAVPPESPSHTRVSLVPHPRSPEAAPRSDDGPENADRERHLFTERGLLILIVTATVSLLAGAAAGLSSAVRISTFLGTAGSVAVGISAGIVTLVLTALTVAHGLHKLLR